MVSLGVHPDQMEACTSVRVEGENLTNNPHTCTKRRETGCKLGILWLSTGTKIGDPE